MEDPKYPINERIRQLAAELKVPKPHAFGLFLDFVTVTPDGKKEGSTERVRKVFNHENQAGLELIEIIARKVAEKLKRKVNTHWIITGDGPMFLDESYKSDNNLPGSDLGNLSLFVMRLANRLKEVENTVYGSQAAAGHKVQSGG